MNPSDYTRALCELHALKRFGMRQDLKPVAAVAARLGHPYRRYPVVHIAGTNGKGSTAAMIDAIARADGRRTGLFTSPHLSRFGERIRLSGKEIAQEEIALRLAQVKRATRDETLTFFETATLMALEHFADCKVDLAILEVGLGGRLDATNLVESPAVTIVTGVALDHEEHLGQALGDIAREKAGIFKRGCAAVAGLPEAEPARGEVRAVLEERAQSVGAPLDLRGEAFDLVCSETGGFVYRGPGGPLHIPTLGLQGTHQRHNAALALRAAIMLRDQELLGRKPCILEQGLAKVAWPARLEWIGSKPRVLLDAAHNPDATRVLCQSLEEMSERPRVLVFGALADKNVAQMAALLRPLFDRVFLTLPPAERALPIERLVGLFPDAAAVPRAEDALVRALEAARQAGPKAIVVVTGSIYLCGHVRARLLGDPSDPFDLSDSVKS